MALGRGAARSSRRSRWRRWPARWSRRAASARFRSCSCSRRVFGTAATLLSQLALGLERTAAWSLRYPLENGVIVIGAIVLYPIAGLDGAIAAVALGAAAALRSAS